VKIPRPLPTGVPPGPDPDRVPDLSGLKTGRVRGLLCSGCNHAVGKVRDSPDTLRRLADYLDRNTTPTQR
jgi:hypothetical protein